ERSTHVKLLEGLPNVGKHGEGSRYCKQKIVTVSSVFYARFTTRSMHMVYWMVLRCERRYLSRRRQTDPPRYRIIHRIATQGRDFSKAFCKSARYLCGLAKTMPWNCYFLLPTTEQR